MLTFVILSMIGKSLKPTAPHPPPNAPLVNEVQKEGVISKFSFGQSDGKVPFFQEKLKIIDIC